MSAIANCIGTRMFVEKLSEIYPDSWVGLSDCQETDNGMTGIVESVCTDSEQRYFEMKRLIAENKKVTWIYTTPYKGVSALWQV